MDDVVRELRDSPNSFSKQKELLKLLRTSKIRRSDLVQEFGTKMLAKKSRLGSDGKCAVILPSISYVYIPSVDRY